MSLGEKIKSLREQVGLSQIEVATFLGVTRITYSNYEKGKTIPGFDVMQQIARLGKVAISYFEDHAIEIPEVGNVKTDKNFNEVVSEINKITSIDEMKRVAIELAIKERTNQDEIISLRAQLVKLLSDLKP